MGGMEEWIFFWYGFCGLACWIGCIPPTLLVIAKEHCERGSVSGIYVPTRTVYRMVANEHISNPGSLRPIGQSDCEKRGSHNSGFLECSCPLLHPCAN